VELTTYRNGSCSGAPVMDVGARAEAIICDFYRAQGLRHARERERLEKSAYGVPSLKWNRQELYLDRERCDRAHAASRRHLAKHPQWLYGRGRLDGALLRDVVAMQHFLEVDLEDLVLPEADRRSSDTWVGASGDVCEQLVLDAPRSTYAVEGEEFDFASEAALNGAGDGTYSSYMQQQSAFTDRVVAALQRCLGGDPPSLLLRLVSQAMSQSGLANVERACDMPQVAVCGGDQVVRYELRSLADGNTWELQLSVQKFGFEQCIIHTAVHDPALSSFHEPEPQPVRCRSNSNISKLCRLRVSVPCAGGGVEVDVLELHKDFRIVDRHGRSLPGLNPAPSYWPPMLGPLVATVRDTAKRMCGLCICQLGLFSVCLCHGASRLLGRVLGKRY